MTGEQPPRARPPDARRRLLFLLLVNSVALFVALGGLLWIISQPLGPPVDQGLRLGGEALLQQEAARQGLAEGQPAPGFGARGSSEPLELTDLSGDRVALSDFLGRPVWVVFWATYCHACRLEEPDMRRAFAAYRAQGLTLLAIDVGEGAGVVRRYAEARGLPWTVLLDESGAAVEAFGAIGTPSHYFVGPDGMIQSRAFGRLDYVEMREHIAPLLGGQRRP